MGNQWYLRTQDEVFGPVTRDALLEWARMGRIQPGQDVSSDGETWCPATEIDFLDMRWSIDIGDGTPRGPFNKQAAQALLASGRLPRGSRLVEVAPKPAAEPVPEPRPEPAPRAASPSASSATASADEREALQRQIETLKAGLHAAEARANEAERRMAEARSEARTAVKAADVAEARLAAVQEEMGRKNADLEAAREAVDREKAAAREAVDREKSAAREALAAKDSELAARESDFSAKNSELKDALAQAERAAHEAEAKAVAAESDLADLFSASKASAENYESRIQSLSDEIRRLPPTAQLAADAQAAVYALMKEEADELAAALEAENREAEALRQYRRQRAERLLARRQEILRRIGTDAEDMTRRALKAHPEDPRTVHMRQELDALRLLQERSAAESERKIRDLSTKLRASEGEVKQLRTQVADTTAIYRQLQEARERLMAREKELVETRQKAEADRQQHEASQQSLLARLSALEMGMPGTTHQSREARNVRLAPWMGLKK